MAHGSSDQFGNEPSLRLVDSLLEHFDTDYRYATSHIRNQSARDQRHPVSCTCLPDGSWFMRHVTLRMTPT